MFDFIGALPGLRHQLAGYALKHIFNADEFVLKYCLSADRTILNRQLSGLKQYKTRTTCIECCNGTGSENKLLQINGRAKCPRAFEKESARELGIDH